MYMYYTTIDIDECADDSTNDCDKEEGQCTDTPGGYTCSCITGYTGDGFTCSGNRYYDSLYRSYCRKCFSLYSSLSFIDCDGNFDLVLVYRHQIRSFQLYHLLINDPLLWK